MKKMRIGVIGIRGLPANYGGFEVTAENIVKRLAQRGHEITIYCRGFANGKPKELEGMRLIYLPSLELPHLSTPSHTTIAAMDAFFRKFDAVFAFNVGNALQVALLRLAGKKSVLFVDGLDWKRDKYGSFGKWFLRNCENLAAKVAGHVVVDALPAQEHYFKAHGTEAHFIPSGSDIIEQVDKTGILDKLGLESGNFVISIGRLTPEKRQHLIAEAFKQVRTDMKLVIVGGNPYDTEYIRKVETCVQGDDRIIYTGPIYGKEVDELYLKAAIFINASRIEGTSLSLLQAMGTGCALLVSDIPENHSAVHGELLEFETENFDDFVTKMQRIVDDKDLRQKLSQKAREIVENYYSWDAATDKFEKLLFDIAK